MKRVVKAPFSPLQFPLWKLCAAAVISSLWFVCSRSSASINEADRNLHIETRVGEAQTVCELGQRQDQNSSVRCLITWSSTNQSIMSINTLVACLSTVCCILLNTESLFIYVVAEFHYIYSFLDVQRHNLNWGVDTVPDSPGIMPKEQLSNYIS